jgi:hypothetical protein
MSLRYMSLAILLFAVGVDAPAHAGSQYVASTGTDSAACTRTAPCQTITQAIFNAQPNDTIVCVDSLISLGLQITKSIDVDCSGSRAVVRDSTQNNAAISIIIPVSSADPFRTVRLRGVLCTRSA